MINTDFFIGDDFKGFALWIKSVAEQTDLAYAAECAIEQNLDFVSVAPKSVPVIWPWLENKKIKIFARFYLDGSADSVDTLSELTININTVLKQGADGAQVFIRFKDLDSFVSQLYLIRDDLFFNKDLYVGINIADIGPFDWDDVWKNLSKIHATGLILALPMDNGDKSDFVGRIYSALESWNKNYDFNLHFALGENPLRIEQTKRLVQSMQPDLVDKIRFFINV